MSEPFIGEIRLFAGNFAPAGWAFCDGQLVAIAENDALFTLLGTTYGGDGEETFALPDLRGRVPIHQGNGYALGQTGGVESVTLTTAQLPQHTHALVASTGNGTEPGPAGNLPANGQGVRPYLEDAPDSPLHGGVLAPAGGSQPHENLQPYVCVHYIIALFGLFPPPS